MTVRYALFLCCLGGASLCTAQEIQPDSLVLADTDFAEQTDTTVVRTSSGFSWLQRAEKPEFLRVATVTGIGVGFAVGELSRRKQDYRRLTGPFTVENDWSYTRWADKFGHVFFTHYMSQAFGTGYRWAGYSDKQAAVLGAASGFTGMLYYEILDGFGRNENFSPIDVAANGVGASLYAGRAYVPALEHIHLKMSFWPTDSSCDYTCDYEGQTAWITANPSGLAPNTPLVTLPPWLNLALGYGARDGDVGQGYETSALYVGLDFEPAGLPIRGKVWEAVVPWLQLVHFPAPALRLSPDVGFEPLAY
ncbi:MAG: DUF2279 domain-containing protein [Rubricoccaceae bacterium]|nr:DUF2279 domain-containing protein [Rubricoccaceae bacterium]